MREKIIRFFDAVVYTMIILIPFSMAIAPAPMNILIGWLISSFLIKKLLTKQKLFINTAINVPFLCFFIVSLISTINTVSYKDSFRGLFRLVQYMFIFLIMVQELKDKTHIKRIFLSMTIGISLLSIDALWQVIFGKDFIRGRLPILNIGIKRATASFPDANVLGIYLSAIIPIIFVLTFYYFKNKQKRIMLLVSLLGSLGLVLTYSRPTILAIYLSLLLLGAIKKDKILLSILVILTIIAPFIMPQNIKNWAKEVDYHPIRFMCNDDRIAIYRNTLNMIKAHPLIGVGVNTFMKNYRKYKESPEYRNIITSDYVYAHNNFLHIAGEIGFIGLGIFLWLIYKLFRKSVYIYNKLKDNFLKNISLGIFLCLISFLINGLTESSLYYSRVAVIFWYLIGFSLALDKFIHANRS